MSGKDWRRWEPVEVTTLRQLLRHGEPFAVIADEIGRSAKSVMNKAHGLGLHAPYLGRPRSVELRARVLEMVGMGLNSTQMSRILKRHRTQVYRILLQLVDAKLVRRTGGKTSACRFQIATPGGSRRSKAS